MKTLILLILSTLAYNTSSAQCTKNLLLKFDGIKEIRGTTSTSFKSSGTISFSKEKILILTSINGADRVIESIIDSVSACSWDRYMKNGKSSYNLLSSKDPDEPKDKATLTLEGENGKLLVTFRPPGAELQFLIAELKIVE